jgi:hypothetical protein
MMPSAKKPWAKFINRDTLQGRGGGKAQRAFRGEAAYVKRLRRLEVLVLYLMGEKTLPKKVVDSMVQLMLDLEQVVEPKAGSGSKDPRGAVDLPHSGPTGGQGEGEADSDGGTSEPDLESFP